MVRKKFLFVCCLVMEVGIAFADATVSNVKARQRYPWNGLVDIDYTIAGDSVGLDVLVTVSNKTSGLTYLPPLSSQENAADPGKHRITWATESEGLSGQILSQMIAKVALAQKECDGPYLVIDLSEGSLATTYPVEKLDHAPTGGWTDVYKTTKIVMRYVKAGSFIMGSSQDELGHLGDETQHMVTLTKGFWMGVFEVTQRQWELVMGDRPSHFTNDLYYATRPVECVSYDRIRGSSEGAGWPACENVDTDSFMGIVCGKTGMKIDLPSEAQWEYACRAGTMTSLNNGRNLTAKQEDQYLAEIGRYCYNGGTNGFRYCNTSGGTAKVGTYAPNDWGLYDMHGNVFEWTLDWYDAQISTGAEVDPRGANSGSHRVLRGGAWTAQAYACRSAFRECNMPQGSGQFGGFRVCCNSSQPDSASQLKEFSSRVSESFMVDGRPDAGVLMRSDGSETLRYSTDWDGGSNESAKVTIKQDETILVENLKGEGDRAWSVTKNGTYNLTHTTYTNGAVAKVLKATFIVTGRDDPFALKLADANQRYPWNGLVDMTFTVTGESAQKYEVSFTAKDVVGNTNLTMRTFADEKGDVQPASNVLSPGTYRWAWNAAADLPDGFECDRVTISGTIEESLGGVQLWENGPYWAECNVGATKPEECGYYFWWGDSVGYKRNANDDGWVSVKDGTSFTFEEVNCPTYGKDNSTLQAEGYIDSTVNLVSAHDAATAHLGTPWRMPTHAEIVALISNCTTAWVTRNGVYGRLVTGKGTYASKSIFLPAAGYGLWSKLYRSGLDGDYWSSAPYSDDSRYAWEFFFCSVGVYGYDWGRDYGHSIRPLRGFAK